MSFAFLKHWSQFVNTQWPLRVLADNDMELAFMGTVGLLGYKIVDRCFSDGLPNYKLDCWSSIMYSFLHLFVLLKSLYLPQLFWTFKTNSFPLPDTWMSLDIRSSRNRFIMGNTWLQILNVNVQGSNVNFNFCLLEAANHGSPKLWWSVAYVEDNDK